jgi:hypothetical protein
MARKRWRMVLALTALLAQGTAQAGPFFGDWGWCWHQARDCPRGQYSPLHYWTPMLYRARADVHRPNLDQYPPGPEPSVPPSYETTKYRCRTAPSMPKIPYADPAAYYGRSVIPE